MMDGADDNDDGLQMASAARNRAAIRKYFEHVHKLTNAATTTTSTITVEVSHWLSRQRVHI